jgi:outer membrane protein OmpA-like peptidoglycan-associated protein
MKKTITLLSLILLLSSNNIAQDRYVASDAWGLGFGFTYPMYVSINDASLNTSEFYGGFLSIQRNFSESLSWRLRAAYNHVAAQYYANYQDPVNFDEFVTNDMITGDLDFLYYFNPCEPIAMFLLAGAGLNYNEAEGLGVDPELDGESNTVAQFNIGAGVDIRLGEDWRLHGEGVYHTTGNSKIDGRDSRSGSSSDFFGGSFFGGNSNDSWIHADIGLLYYFSKGEPSKICQLYTGIAEVDYDKIEDIVKRYQTEPCEIDYNRIEDIVKRHCGKAIVEDKWVLIGVNFDFNKSTLRTEAYPILDHAAQILLGHTDVNIEIQGHTDQIGSDKYNDKLSLQRAETVKKYLIAKGVAGSRLTTNGKGKRELLFQEKDAVSRFYNRRVEFHTK